MSVYAIKQSINSGQNFTGADPGTDPVTTNGVKVYPIADIGGLFDPERDTAPSVLMEMQLVLADQSAWAVTILDGTDEFPVVSGTNETEYLYHPNQPLYLLPGQQIKLTTTGASAGAMFAIVIISAAMLGEQ